MNLSEKTIEVARFVVEGEFITKIVRQIFWFDKTPLLDMRAVEVLNCLIPLPTKTQKNMVLFGEGQLVGNSTDGMYFVEEADEAFKEKLEERKQFIRKNYVKIGVSRHYQ